MALTRGTVQPFAPYSPGGTSQSGTILSLPVNADAFRKGDVVVIASGLADPVDATQSDGVIVGVALEAKAANASATFQDQVLVAAALPGALFTGHLISSAGTDYTSNAAAAITPTVLDTVLNTDTYAAFICIDQGSTGGQIRPIQYDNTQVGGKAFSAFGNTNIINPRVIFCFRSSVFQPLV